MIDFKLLHNVLNLVGNIGYTGKLEWRQILEKMDLFGLFESLVKLENNLPAEILDYLCWMIKDIAKVSSDLNISEEQRNTVVKIAHIGIFRPYKKCEVYSMRALTSLA